MKALRIVHGNREMAESTSFDVPWAGITVHDPGAVPHCLPGRNLVGSLHLSFHDLRGTEPADVVERGGLVPFDHAQARAIRTFVGAVRSRVEVLAIYCEAGVSRSAGIAVALCELLGLPVPKTIKGTAPNPFVVRLLLEDGPRPVVPDG